jgi:hypothetical protein
MVVCAVLGVGILARSIPSLRGLWWQLVVGSLLFGPLLLGVLGGQIVGLSVLLYAALIGLNVRVGRGKELLFGVVTGVWMFKPHYALAVVAMMVFQRRWTALGGWAFVSGLLWVLGAQLAGVHWVSDWLSFAQQFSQIDLVTNSYQMTGLVPALHSMLTAGGGPSLISPHGFELLNVVCALLVPLTLFVVVRRARGTAVERMVPLLAVGPLLLLCAPAVNFYDLSLGLVSLLAIFHPRERRELGLATSLLVASQFLVLCKGTSGGAFLFALVLVGIAGRVLSRRVSSAN